MPDEPTPPRKFYGFKPREFEVANPESQRPPTPADLTADGTPNQPAPDPGIVPVSTGRIDIHELHRAATRGQPPLSPPKAPSPANEIHDVLRDNLTRANAAGLNDISERPRRPSRRKRDYWLAIAFGNLVLIVATAIMPIYGIAGIIIFNTGLTWIMWFVMDDY